MNRGAARQRIFFTKHDARQFLALLGEAAGRFGIEIHAYCLMTNHYHLLVRCPTGGLSESVHHLASHYVRYLNARLERDGPLFRGRFHAIRLHTTDYVHHVGRYIHRNPVDIRPAVALDQYEWSSFRYYAHDRAHPEWLRMDHLLSAHGSRGEYRSFVEDVRRGVGESPWDWAVDMAVAEVVDEASTRANIARTVAVALLDAANPSDRPDIERWLDFPTSRARAMAVSRMRARRAISPVVAQVAARALDLAA